MDASDEVTVEGILAGDREQFRTLVERHSHRVFRLAFRITGREQDAEEVVQETFLRAYRQLKRFESRSTFSTWLYRIAVNCALDWMRKEKRYRNRDISSAEEAVDVLEALPDGAPQADRMVFSEDVRKKLGLALQTLGEKERTVFMLRHEEEMSLREIGDLLQISENAAKHCLFRAVRKLRQEFQPLVKTG